MTRHEVPLSVTHSDETILRRSKDAAPLFKALADENRLMLVLLLAERSRTVRELSDATGLSQTLVSHHLKPLRELNLVEVTPKGRSNVYSVCCAPFSDPLKTLAGIATAQDRIDQLSEATLLTRESPPQWGR
ncbi:ArsR/SmtB family transcription factor [Haloglycomyces albus]|uniref:ArsR/SmtB family transcription factor n=1 Tax=Haloglycomyces albus TaxID=526067 RepID=UPI00046CA2A5|nr:metalloregulator ArsR/SmtB family transcription factor [Haloglycomyces albus]